MFRQYDGEPCKHGLELAEFLSTLKIVEGLGIDNYRVANGAADLAAQVVVRFKKDLDRYICIPAWGIMISRTPIMFQYLGVVFE